MQPESLSIVGCIVQSHTLSGTDRTKPNTVSMFLQYHDCMWPVTELHEIGFSGEEKWRRGLCGLHWVHPV